MAVSVTMTINGREVAAEVEPRTLLVDFLRRDQGLTGTHVGCDTSQCGACTVHMDGLPVKSCTILTAQVDGHAVTTIEGLADGDELHPMQTAFNQHHGLQCGFCTPGMILAAIGIAERHETLSEEIIRHELDGNICRCTGYHNIVRAIEAGARAMKG